MLQSVILLLFVRTTSVYCRDALYLFCTPHPDEDVFVVCRAFFDDVGYNGSQVKGAPVCVNGVILREYQCQEKIRFFYFV